MVHRHQKRYSNIILQVLVSVVVIIAPAMTIPQIYKIFSTQNAESVSAITWIANILISGVWLWYGLEHKKIPIVINSCIGGVLSIIVVIGVFLF
jgi:uncharacterized protein with PQ loop repeat